MATKHAQGAPRRFSGPGASTRGGSHMNRGPGGKSHKVPDMYAGSGVGGKGPSVAGKGTRKSRK